MPLKIVRNDITKVKADAIVNTANPLPIVMDGTDRAVYEAAGYDLVLAERKKIGRLFPGECAVTSAYQLKADYLFHTVGPVWIDGLNGESEVLGRCYQNCLSTAFKMGLSSIAFPLISTGVYGFPKALALKIAVNVISDFLLRHEMDITLVVFDKESFELSGKLFDDVKSYIDEHYVYQSSLREYRYEGLPFKANTCAPVAESKPSSLEDFLREEGQSFQEKLFELIDERGLSDAQVYHRANMDRKLFSKIRCSKDYIPKKRTVLSLAIALELNLDETEELLECAGYALSRSSKADLIVEYFITHQIYDIYTINMALFQHNQPCLQK